MFGALRAIFRPRTPKPLGGQRWVLVTVEFPWEDEKIRRLGTVEDVLGARTLDELVRTLTSEHSSAVDLLPDNCSFHIRGPRDDQFHTTDGQTAARSLVANGPQAGPSAGVHQLRIRVIPCFDEVAPDRRQAERHTDLADEVERAPLQPEAASPASADDAPAPAAPAGQVESQPAGETGKKVRAYMRKADMLRAQLLPRIEALDFAGLFVGTFGFRGGTTVRSPRVSLLSPAEANRFLMLANQSRRTGEWDQAATHYRTLITHDPDNQDFWFLLGKVEQSRGDMKQALHAFQNALRLGHGSARDEIRKVQGAAGEAADEHSDLVSLWRPTFPPPHS